MNNFKDFCIFIIILLCHLTFIVYIKDVLHPIQFSNHNIFFLDLVGITVNVPFGLLLFFEIGNLILLWLIGRHFFSNRFSLVPPAINAISPWSSYLLVAGSFYIYLTFLLLASFYGLLLIKSNIRLSGSIILVITTVAAIYSSLPLMLTIPMLVAASIILKVIPFKNLRYPLLIIAALLLPLLFLVSTHQVGFKNITNNEIKIFSDPSILNMVNGYYGAAEGNNIYKSLVKISENKYLFFTESFLIKYLKQLIPSTYFTQQEKLLNFSFTPPIYLGFLIPFIYGFYKMLKLSNLRRILAISSLLIFPSLMAKQSADLNRLVIFAPVIVFVITYGFFQIYNQFFNTKGLSRKVYLIFLIITFSLVIFQLTITLSDIQLREKERFVKYFGQNIEIGRQ